MDRLDCQAVGKQGERCGGWALPGSRFCWAHAPEHEADRRAARAKGGRVKAIVGRQRRLRSAAAVVDFLSGLAHDLVDGTKDPEMVRAVAYVLSVQLRGIELAQKSEIEARLSEAERLLAQRRIR